MESVKLVSEETFTAINTRNIILFTKCSALVHSPLIEEKVGAFSEENDRSSENYYSNQKLLFR
jgi:hypothetical protein